MNDYEDYPDGRVCCMGCQIISGRTPFPHEAGCVVQRAEQAEAEVKVLEDQLDKTILGLSAMLSHFDEESGVDWAALDPELQKSWTLAHGIQHDAIVALIRIRKQREAAKDGKDV